MVIRFWNTKGTGAVHGHQISRTATTMAASTGASTSAAGTTTQKAMTREQLHSDIRYAIRLTQRTARLYRRAQFAAAFLSVVGGSAIVGTLGVDLPRFVSVTGALLFLATGAALLIARPGDKAAMNEADSRRYQALMAKAVSMSDIELQQALEEARQSDVPEVEPLRDVAYNDVVVERGSPGAVVPLTLPQRVLAALA